MTIYHYADTTTPFSLVIFISLLLLILLSIPTFSPLEFSQNITTASPFECGFSPFFHSRSHFQVQFFLIALLFVLFDLEIALLTPSLVFGEIFFWGSTLFAGVVTVGLYIEWKTINW